MARRAYVVSSQEPHGVALIKAECAAQQVAFDESMCRVLTVPGKRGSHGQLLEEEVVTYGCSAIWTSGRGIRKRFTTTSEIIQAEWVHFHEYGKQHVLCLLQKNALTSILPSGEVLDTPMQLHYSALWPLQQGLLLVGPRHSSIIQLTHPLGDVRPVVADCSLQKGGPASYAGWSGEAVVWTSRELPYVATYEEGSGRIAIWHMQSATEEDLAMGSLFDLPAVSPGGLGPRTPAGSALPVFAHHTPMSASSFAGTSYTASTTKRSAIRTADGFLSPGVFNPTPRLPPMAFTPNTTTAQRLLLPGPDPVFVFKLVHRAEAPDGAVPTEGHLATELDGTPLLCLLCEGAGVLLAYRLPPDSSSPRTVQLAFSTHALAAATLSATHTKAPQGPLPELQELLLLQPDGNLVLQRGQQLLCRVAVDLPSSVVRPASVGARQGQRRQSGASTGGASELMAESESDDGMEMSAADTTPFFSGAAAQSAPGVCGLAGAVGDRVSLMLSNGARVRVALPLGGVGSLPGQALEALQAVLPAPTHHALYGKYLVHPGSCSGSLEREWAALSEVLLAWAADADSLTHPSDPASTPALTPMQQQQQQPGAWGATAATPASHMPAVTPQTPVGAGTSGLEYAGSDDGMELATPETAGARSRMSGTPMDITPQTKLRPQQQQQQQQGQQQQQQQQQQQGQQGTGGAWEWLLASGPPPNGGGIGRASLHNNSNGRYGWLTQSTAATLRQPGQQAAAALSAARSFAHRQQMLQVLYALHSVYEDCKLDRLRWPLLQPLSRVLLPLAAALGAGSYCEFYDRDQGPMELTGTGQLTAARLQQQQQQQVDGGQQTAAGDAAEALRPPGDILRALSVLLSGSGDPRRWLPLLAECEASSTPRSVQMLQCYKLLQQCAQRCAAATAAAAAAAASSPAGASAIGGVGAGVLGSGAAESLALASELRRVLQGSCRELVLLLVRQGWDVLALETLPLGVALPLREALQRCRHDPPSGWPIMAYALVGREDIAATLTAASGSGSSASDAAAKATSASPGSGAARVAKASPAAPTPASMAGITPGITPPAQQAAGAAGTPPLPTGIGRMRQRASATHVAPSDAAAAAQQQQDAVAPSGPSEASQGSGARQSSQLLVAPYSQRLQLSGQRSDTQLPLGDQAAQATLQESAKKALHDGMDGLTEGVARLRFGRDDRLTQVRHLLGSAAPSPLLHIEAAEGDPELVAKQQTALLAAAARTMSLPLGRGALTLGTMAPLPTEPLGMPVLCLSGTLAEGQHATEVDLDLRQAPEAPGGGAAAELTCWPEFHNGVASGLRLAMRGNADDSLTRSWMVYQRPSFPSYSHAGLLMALGLTGHLHQLSWTDLYRHLSEQHDATTIGVILGMSAARRATMDATVSRMLFLHLPARHPTSFPEIELSSMVQAAALLGVGLLYEGSCHRLMAEILLEEIGRRPGIAATGEQPQHASTSVTQDREGYALAAGLALGLVCLGKGHNAPGLADLQLVDRLRHLMVGGTAPQSGSATRTASSTVRTRNVLDAVLGPGVVSWDSLTGDDPTGAPPMFGQAAQALDSEHMQAFGISQVVLESAQVNTSVTSPAATLALTLMYLRTNDTAIAARFAVPDTAYALSFVRPDFVLLRVLGRALVLWDGISPTDAWIDGQLPPLLAGPLSKLQRSSSSGGSSGFRSAPAGLDRAAVAAAHVQGVAGACLAIGLRFAGTCSARAEAALRHRALELLAAKRRLVGDGVRGSLDRAALEACLEVVVLALSLVMAGSGHLPTLRLLQHLSRRTPTSAQAMEGGAAAAAGVPTATAGLTYGNHMAISMALGFLFLSGGARTFGTNNGAIAALLISVYPRFPAATNDHRCHLQAFRHLYVLASQSRCIEARDVDTKQRVYAPVGIIVQQEAMLGPSDAPQADGNAADVPTGAGEGEDGALRLSTRENWPKGAANGAGAGESMAWSPPEQAQQQQRQQQQQQQQEQGQQQQQQGQQQQQRQRQCTPEAGPRARTPTPAGRATPTPAPRSQQPPRYTPRNARGRGATAAGGREGRNNRAPGQPASTASPGAAGAASSPGVAAPDTSPGAAGSTTPAVGVTPGRITPARMSPGSMTPVGSGAPGRTTPGSAQGRSMDPMDTDEADQGLFFSRMAPCMLPELEYVRCVSVQGPRYWTQSLDHSAAPATAAAAAAAISSGPATASGSAGVAIGVGSSTHQGADGASGSGSSSSGSALSQLYRQQQVWVKKKAGSLPYADDPSGIRSLLSRAFQRTSSAAAVGSSATPLEQGQQRGPGEQHQLQGQQARPGAAFDIVHLCNTFSADPFIMSFAQSVSALEASAASSSSSSSSSSGAGADSDSDMRRTAEVLSFCRGALYECITQEKTAILPWYLNLYCLVQALSAPGAHTNSSAVAATLAATAGGAGPTVALWSLKLARSYYSSSIAAATAICREAATALAGSAAAGALADGAVASGVSVHEQDADAWAPLLQPMFLDSLWKLLQRRWQELGLLPSEGPGAVAVPGAGGVSRGGGGVGVGGSKSAAAVEGGVAGSSAVGWYLQNGSHAGLRGAVEYWRQQQQQQQQGGLEAGNAAANDWAARLLGCCLVMHDVPTPEAVDAARTAVQQMVATLGLPGPLTGMHVLPLLAAQLPDVAPEALLLIASCLC